MPDKSKHLLHIAKHRIVSPEEIHENLAHNTSTQRYIGALPIKTIQNIPHQKRAEITAKTDEIFADFAASVSFIVTNDRVFPNLDPELFYTEYTKLEKQLRQLFQNNNIIVTYVDSGTYKHCFYINFGTQDTHGYALQTFQNLVIYSKTSFHGVLFEPQNYFTAYKLYSNGRVSRPFMARPTVKEISSDGYILTKYIDFKQPAKKYRGRFIKHRDMITSEDIIGDKNTHQGIVVDAGGFEYNQARIADKKLYYKWHEFAQILDSMDFYSDYAYNASLYLLQQYKKSGNQFFDTNSWPQMLSDLDAKYVSYAKRMLRSLRRLKLKRDTLEQQGTYKQIQQLLHQDFVELFNFFRVNSDIQPAPNMYNKYFYPEIVCKILGVNNVPTLDHIAMYCGSRIEICSDDGKKRVHWNKYYTIDEVVAATQKHTLKDWSVVINDFNQKTFFERLLQKIRLR